jgi:hypothetical protein
VSTLEHPAWCVWVVSCCVFPTADTIEHLVKHADASGKQYTADLARFYLVVDTETRRDMINLMAQGKVPEASHLCGHPWCDCVYWEAC